MFKRTHTCGELDKSNVGDEVQLNGWINIYLNHYLYIETQLTLRKEGTKQVQLMPLETNTAAVGIHTQAKESLEEPFLLSLPMKQHRRVISDEIHYFDHPNLGIIMQIRKMKQPEKGIEVN